MLLRAGYVAGRTRNIIGGSETFDSFGNEDFLEKLDLNSLKPNVSTNLLNQGNSLHEEVRPYSR